MSFVTWSNFSSTAKGLSSPQAKEYVGATDVERNKLLVRIRSHRAKQLPFYTKINPIAHTSF
jgi:hypothetical protein